MPAEEAFRRVAEGESADGDMEFAWSVHSLSESYFLKGMGAIKNSATVDLELQRAGEHFRTVRVETLATEMEGRQDKLAPPPGAVAPMFLSHLDKTYWHRPLPNDHAIFVQVNNLHDSGKRPVKTIEEYGTALWLAIDRAKPRNLVLDLRHNNGGTTQLYPELLRTLTAFSRVGGNQLYVLIGRRTYSAAGNFVTDLERLTNPIFVGEASSECCNFFGDPTSVRLPYSGIQGEFTAMKWNLSTPGDGRREMSPDVPVQLTARDYFAGRDPALDAVLRLMRERQPAKQANKGR
jgi:hypothetical protein